YSLFTDDVKSKRKEKRSVTLQDVGESPANILPPLVLPHLKVETKNDLLARGPEFNAPTAGDLHFFHDISRYTILGIFCMALGSPWASSWYVFVAVTSFITTLMWSFVYLLSIREALKLPINWVLSELISTTFEAFFFLIAFIVMFTSVYGSYAKNVAAAVFGLFNTLAYAGSSYLLFQEHRASLAVSS
ncbi:unnamed protein product, partial [Parnassius apollo]